MALTCTDIGKLVHPYLDGEFSDEDRVALEQHTSDCAECFQLVRYEMAFKAAMRAKLSPPKAPSGLRSRVVGALDELDRLGAGERRAARWAWLLPATAATAAAAAIALFFLMPAGSRHVTQRPVNTAVAPDVVEGNPFIPAHQARPLPVNATNRDQLQRALSREVGVRVRLPQFPELGGTPTSARVAELRGLPNRRGLQITYSLPGLSDDLSVLVFDPTDVRVPAKSKRRIGDIEVLCDSDRGYNSVFFTKGGVGYAFTSGALDEEQLLRLVGELEH